MDDDLNFTMNVNTNIGGICNLKNNKKNDKKEKYLERKMLQQKRKREKNSKNVKEKNEKSSTKHNSIENTATQSTVGNVIPDKSQVVEHEYDELNNFYKNKEKKLQKSLMSHTEKRKKQKEVENQITEEYKEIIEDKENLDNKLKEKNNSVFSIKKFEDLVINQYLKKALTKNNYTVMTKMQKISIPILIKHKNVVVKSETGSGKTLAYIIPLYEHLIKINEMSKITRKDGVYSIIFAPTHELCLQIEENFSKLTSACINVVFGCLMGGQKIEREKQKLRKGLNVIISTPGRLLYHLKNTQNIIFDKLKVLIFDEGDKLMDMGFEKDIKECLSLITKKNAETSKILTENNDILNSDCFKKLKIYLISATIDNKIRSLVEYLMKGFKTVGFDMKLSNEDEMALVPKGLNQFYSIIYDEFRLIHLIAFLKNNLDKKIMIFVSTCDMVNFLQNILLNLETDKLNDKDTQTQSNTQQAPTQSNNPLLINTTKIYKLHGKMTHTERKEIFKEFNVNEPGIMISTDVASRGLDFPMVDWIIHYDVNPDPKEYLNRMGRTARLDQTGNSLIFLMKHEKPIISSCLKNFNLAEIKCGKILLEFVKKINADIKEKIKIEPMVSYQDEVDENEKFRKKYFFVINPLQRCIKSYLFTSRDYLILARKAFKSSIRSYVTFMRFQKDVFNVKQLNLTRFARSFGLYKESTKIKVGDKEMHVDYQMEKNRTKGERKFANKKIQRKLLISEFDN